MRKLIKSKRLLVIITLIAGAIIGSCFFFGKEPEKQQYDYSDYLVPSEQIEDEEYSELHETVLSLAQLQLKNPDVVGILEFDNRMIYEPVAQAPDNEYYLKRNIDHDYASAGIPFVGAEGNIYSTNVVIYGHSSTKRDIIFTPLMNYKQESFYKEHPTFTFITMEETRTYQIVAVFEYDTTDINDSAEFTQFEWRKISDYALFINSLRIKSIYNTGVNVNHNDLLMTIVTCDVENDNERVVIVAKLVP